MMSPKPSSERAARDQAILSDSQAKPPAASGPPPPPVYPTGFAFALTLFALFISLFCVALDSTIIATAIPRITDQFHSLQDVGWYGSSYLLTKCGKLSSWPLMLVERSEQSVMEANSDREQLSNSPSAKPFASLA
jgi:hypothetical protein